MCGVTGCPTAACLQSGERQVRICERRRPGGGAAWEEVHASPIHGAGGGVDYVVEVWRDISERRAAEARLAESHRLASLGLLASGFSHELNTPLATVLMCVEGILREARPRARRRTWRSIGESAAIAREQLLRCRGITQHFLRMSRGQSSAGDIVDLAAAVSAAERLVDADGARALGDRIEVGPLAAGLHVRADEADLQHALINLLLNAMQACAPAATVMVRSPAGDPVAHRDSRPGVRHRAGAPEAHLRAVLQPAPGRHRPRPLPLAELRPALGRRHRRGERARRRLDLRDRPPALWQPRESFRGRASRTYRFVRPMNTTSILLVDDDAAFRHVMAGELKRLGFDVITAGTGAEASARPSKARRTSSCSTCSCPT